MQIGPIFKKYLICGTITQQVYIYTYCLINTNFQRLHKPKKCLRYDKEAWNKDKFR